MYYFFTGTDTHTSIRKARDLIESLQKRRPDASVVELTSEDFALERIDELLYGQGLFVEKCIVYLNRVSEAPGALEGLVARRKDIAASQNIFVIREASIDKKSESALIKDAEKHQTFSARERKAPAFNAFSLGDALAARDRKTLWLKYLEARHAGMNDEEIAGTLFWQLKAMRLAANASRAEEAGLKPFVFGKAKRAARNYTDDELRTLTAELVSIYHDSHRGLREFDAALEQFVLTV